MLIGIVVKNGIVLIDYITLCRERVMAVINSVVTSGKSRLRPVLMTSFTTILGMLPLLFDSMFGAMAATIMGGLLVATLLTVCVLPVVYALFYNIRKP